MDVHPLVCSYLFHTGEKQTALRRSSTNTSPPAVHVWVPHHVPAADVSQVDHHVHLWSPQLDFSLPRGEGGQWHDQQERPVQLVFVEHVVEEANSLDRLPQAHFISKDAAVAPGEEARERRRFRLCDPTERRSVHNETVKTVR